MTEKSPQTHPLSADDETDNSDDESTAGLKELLKLLPILIKILFFL